MLVFVYYPKLLMLVKCVWSLRICRAARENQAKTIF